MNRRGFTLSELLVATSVLVILVGLTGASFISIQRLVGRQEDELILAQNARVVIDRISRDLRQAILVVDAVPTTLATATNSLEFEDGHNINPEGPTYLRYSHDAANNTVWRRRVYYYDPAYPAVRVQYNQVLVGNGTYVEAIIAPESYLIAEHVTDLNFYGSDSHVQIDVTLQVSPDAPSQTFHSSVAKRN